MTTPLPSLSVLAPLTPAIERVKTVLFRPFDPGRWVTLAFCAWLAGLGRWGGGGGGGGHANVGSRHSGSARHELRQAGDYVVHNLHWLLPLVVGLVVLGLCVWVLLTWLSSRGQFLFLHGVVTNRAEIREPWRDYRDPANSLFWFRLALGLVSFLIVFPAAAGGTVLILWMLLEEHATLGLALASAGALGGALVFGVLFAVVGKLTLDFVVPIMAATRSGCRAAWGQLLGLIRPHKVEFVLYLGFQVALSIAVGVVVLVGVLLTCCIAGCLLALPFVGTVLLLPILVFDRAYSLYYLEQFGAPYQLISPDSPQSR